MKKRIQLTLINGEIQTKKLKLIKGCGPYATDVCGATDFTGCTGTGGYDVCNTSDVGSCTGGAIDVCTMADSDTCHNGEKDY